MSDYYYRHASVSPISPLTDHNIPSGSGRENTPFSFAPASPTYIPEREGAPSPEERPPSDDEYDDDAGSTYTYSSSQAEDFFETVAGRTIPRRPCVYALPVDDEEKTRQEIGHEMIMMAQPGLILGPFAEVLDPLTTPDEPKRVLDIGTGTGTWAIAVAEEFPSSQVTGIDIVPIQTSILPENVMFRIMDANVPLMFRTASHDLVHARNVQLGIIDYPGFITEIARVLKPGGLLNLVEGDWDVFDSDGEPISPYKNPGWFNWIQAWRAASMQRRIDLLAPQRTEGWLRNSPYYSEVKAAARWMPVGPWTNDATQNRLGEVVWENLKYLIPSVKPLLTEFYHGKAFIADLIIANAWKELASPHSHVFMRWRFFHARRNHREYCEDQPAGVRRRVR